MRLAIDIFFTHYCILFNFILTLLQYNFSITLYTMKRLIIGSFILLASLLSQASHINTAAIDSFIDHIELHNQGIGHVAIAQGRHVIYNRAFNKQAVAPDCNNYRIGSITKLFTATLIHQLCHKGTISLDTTLDNFFPYFPTAHAITIRHLLNHTSGLKDYTIKQDTLPLWLTEKVSEKEILDEIIRQGTIFAPGENQRYSNTAFYLLRRIIERSYMMPYDAVVEREIITPLQLHDTHAGSHLTSDAATPYRINTANRWQQVTDFYFPNVTGVGNIISSPTDLITFIQALYNDTFFDNAASIMQPAEGESFGLGLMLMPFYEHSFYGHAGDTYGSHTAIMYNPTDSITIAICLNGCSTPRNDYLIAICSAIYDYTYTLPDFSELQQYTAPVEELAQYVGTYNTSIAHLPMNITFDEKDRNLSLNITGQPPLWLEAKAPGVFVNTPTGVAIAFKSPHNFIFRQFNRIIIYNRDTPNKATPQP